ncbi:hypothetical protein ACLOJK_007751 [Asimina triloba]
MYMKKKIKVDEYITHKLTLREIDEGVVVGLLSFFLIICDEDRKQGVSKRTL